MGATFPTNNFGHPSYQALITQPQKERSLNLVMECTQTNDPMIKGCHLFNGAEQSIMLFHFALSLNFVSYKHINIIQMNPFEMKYFQCKVRIYDIQ